MIAGILIIYVMIVIFFIIAKLVVDFISNVIGSMVHRLSNKETKSHIIISNPHWSSLKKRNYINHLKMIAPKNWKYCERIYFYRNKDLKALHCYTKTVNFFTNASKIITVPESDNDGKYYLIDMKYTSVHDNRYPNLEQSKLTFITKNSFKKVEVLPKLTDQTIYYLRQHFLLNFVEKRRLRRKYK